MNIKNILIAGGGMMGKNIAFVFTSNPDYQISVYDLYPTDVPGGIRKNCAQLIEKGVLTEAELEERLKRIDFTTDIDSELIKKADLVIEAVSSARPLPSWRRAAAPTPSSAPTPRS